MTVNPLLPVSVTIAPSVNPVCATFSVTYTATPVNGGSNPLYQWKVNNSAVSGATNATYTYVPVNNNAITCVLTSNATCAINTPATSNTVTMTVIPLVPVSVIITASVYAVMPGTSVTFSSTVVNGGTSPAYQWKVNGTAVSGATNSTYTYTSTNTVNNDKVVCVVTSNSTATCLSNNPATSNQIVLIIYHTGTPCDGVPTVVYGNMTYNTVQIGTQCWLRENMNIGTRRDNTVTQTNNGIIEKYCYSNLESNCDVYGGMYQWNEMMQYVTTEGAQGICPSGWHLPTAVQFATLSTFLGGDVVSGGKLKEAGTDHFISPNGGATNVTGFTGLPAGYCIVDPLNPFVNITKFAYFYTTTQTGSDVWYRTLAFDAGNMGILETYKTIAISVRCLKN